MGRVSAPYGIMGWVKVQPFTEALDNLFDYPVWWVGTQDGWREYEVEECKVHSSVLVAKLAGCAGRDAAFALKGKQIAVPRSELPEPDSDEYYWSDLIGLEVENMQQVQLGKITEVFATGANDVLVVSGDRERLIPYIDQVVQEVDLNAKRVRVDWDAEF